MGSILSSAPLDLVDLLFYFKGFEVIEFGFVRLKFCMELVLAGFFLGHVRFFATLLESPLPPQGLLTVSFLSKSTTRPPLSPVAR
jgi:hypothetical protein